MFNRGNDRGRLTGKERVVVALTLGQRAVESLVDSYRGDFSSKTLFVPIMAVPNESTNSWVS